MRFKYIALPLLLLALSCSDDPTKGVLSPSPEDLIGEKPQHISAQQLWARMRALDLSSDQGMKEANLELKKLAGLAKAEVVAIVQELITLKDHGASLMHKLLKGPINSDALAAITCILDQLPDDAAKKAWFEQKDRGVDGLALLLVRTGQHDDAVSLRSLSDQVIGYGVDPGPAIESMWQGIRPARFFVSDQARAHAMAVLMRLSRMPAGEFRRQISREISVKSDMTGTNSGLLQSLVQGPIAADVYQVIETLLADQGDAAAKKSFIEQKLGRLTKPAIYYLKNLNVSGIGNMSTGARLSPLLPEEDPHLGKLIALFLKHGLELKHLFPSNSADADDNRATESVFSLLFSVGQMKAFFDAFLKSEYVIDTEANLAVVDWLIKDPQYAPVLKALFARPDLPDEIAKTFRGLAFIQAITSDMNDTVERHNPVVRGANFLGLGGKEYYSDAVALENFNRLLDNDFGLSLNIPANRQGNMGATEGTVIWGLVATTAFGRRAMPALKKKAVIRTVSKRLKADFSDARSWRDFVLEPNALGENALEALIDLLRISENEAKELLSIS